jgi:hypothetical protein
MVLAYAIVCPWEAVAIGNLLARVFPDINTGALYSVAGKTIFAPRLAVGLALTALIAVVNYRGIRLSGRLQDVTTIGLTEISSRRRAWCSPWADGGWFTRDSARFTPPTAHRSPQSG